MWAMVMAPRSNGQGRSSGQGRIWVKKTSMATPMQISGATIGKAKPPSNVVLPGKRNRHSATAPSAPRATLTRVQTSAMVSELAKACRRSVS